MTASAGLGVSHTVSVQFLCTFSMVCGIISSMALSILFLRASKGQLKRLLCGKYRHLVEIKCCLCAPVQVPGTTNRLSCYSCCRSNVLIFPPPFSFSGMIKLTFWHIKSEITLKHNVRWPILYYLYPMQFPQTLD